MRFSLGLLALLAFPLHLDLGVREKSCQLRGVWQLLSGKYGDYTTPATRRQIKIITKGHFTFVGEGDRGVNELVHGKRGVTPDAALRLERLFGMEAQFWLNLQLVWNLYRVQHSRAARHIRKIRRITPRAKVKPSR